MIPLPSRAGIFFALRPPAGLRRPAGVTLPGRIVRLLAVRVRRSRGRSSRRLSLRRRPCRPCFRASGPSCFCPASGGLSHGFSCIPAPCGFRRALSCPPSFVRMCFLSFTVCRRMPWLPAAFSGDFLFLIPAPAFRLRGLPASSGSFRPCLVRFQAGAFLSRAFRLRGLPAFYGGFRPCLVRLQSGLFGRIFPYADSSSAGRLRLALKVFSFCTAFGQSCFFYSASVFTGALCCLDHQPIQPPR